MRTVSENFSFVLVMECMEFDPRLEILLMTSRFDHAVSILGLMSVVTYEYNDGDIVCRTTRNVSYADRHRQKISFQFRWRYQNIAS